MTSNVIPFPEPEDEGDTEAYLFDAHIKLMHAMLHNQSDDLKVTVVLDLEEVLQLLWLIEGSVDPEHFDESSPE